MPEPLLRKACIRRKELRAFAFSSKGLALNSNCCDARPNACMAQRLHNRACRTVLLLSALGPSFPFGGIAKPAGVNPPTSNGRRQRGRCDGAPDARRATD